MGHNWCDGSKGFGPWAIGSGYRFTSTEARPCFGFWFLSRRTRLHGCLISGFAILLPLLLLLPLPGGEYWQGGAVQTLSLEQGSVQLRNPTVQMVACSYLLLLQAGGFW